MRVKQLWVIAVGFSLLLSAPVWANSKSGETAGGKQKSERRGSPILLKTTKHAELSVLSQRLGDEHPAVSKALSKNDRHDKKASKSHSSKSHVFAGGLPPGLEKKLREIRWHGKGPRVTPSVPAPSVQAAVPIPEPSSLLFFSVGSGRRAARHRPDVALAPAAQTPAIPDERSLLELGDEASSKRGASPDDFGRCSGRSLERDPLADADLVATRLVPRRATERSTWRRDVDGRHRSQCRS